MTETKKMYLYGTGIIDVTRRLDEYYPLVPSSGIHLGKYTEEGRRSRLDKYPTLISLEQAEKQGLVRKQSRKNAEYRIKYEMINENKIRITTGNYGTFDELREILDNDDNIRFISFVDNKLNECDPPQSTTEWEELSSVSSERDVN